MTTVEIGKDNWEKIVVSSDGPVIVDFWAPWCPWCMRLMPVFEELSGTDMARFDVNQLRVVANMETRFLGVIPISITKEYSAYEFVSLMKQDDNSFGCQNANQN